PFRDGAEHRAIIELLERFALAHLACDLTDEHDDRRRVLTRDVQAGRSVGGAGTARHERDAGPAGELADGFRHHHGAALLAAHGHGNIAVMERVERGEITFARHAEHVVDAVGNELIDQHLAAAPHVVLATHRTYPTVFSTAAATAFGSRDTSTAMRAGERPGDKTKTPAGARRSAS